MYNNLLLLLLIVAGLAYMFYKQCAQQIVAGRDFLLPLAGAVYFGITLYKGTNPTIVDPVIIGAVIGLITGVPGGQIVRVWRDTKTGLIYQRGGWSYAFILIGLIVLRVGIYVGVYVSKLAVDFNLLNYVFIAMALGNYLGRNINVHVRSQPLAAWR